MDRAGDEGRPHLNLRREELANPPKPAAAPDSTAAPAEPEPRRRRWPLAVAALFIVGVAIVDWPVLSLTERMSGTIDGSWQMTMHLWGRELPGLGPHIDFTYGPLGFLALPQLWFTTTAVLAWLATLAVTAGCTYVAVARLRRWLPWWAVAIVALFVVRCITLLYDPVEAVPIFAFWWVAGAQLPTLRRRMVAADVLGVLAAALLLCKFGDGLILAGVAVLAPFVWDDRPWRELATAVAGLVVGLVALWSLLTLAPGALPHYVAASMALASGYWQMSLASDTTGARWALIAAPLLGVAVLALVGSDRGLVRRVALALSALWLGWLEFKHSFVRADGFHLSTFFVATVVVALAVGSRRWTWSLLRLVAVVTAMATAVGIAAAGGRFTQPVESAHQFFAQATTLSNGADRARVQGHVKAQLRQRLALPPEIVSAVGRSTVQLDPFTTDAAWVYNLNLAPVPVFQLYSAFTSMLDDENARALTTARAPRFILRNQLPKSVTGGLPAWESPRYQVAELCHYAQALEVGHWQLLEHTTTRCGPWRQVATVPLSGVVNVPEAPAGTILVATFHLSPSALVRAKQTLYRDFPPRIDVDGRPVRLLAGTASAPHLIEVPGDAPNGPYRFEQLNIRTLHLHDAGAGDTVTFWAVPYTPAS